MYVQIIVIKILKDQDLFIHQDSLVFKIVTLNLSTKNKRLRSKKEAKMSYLIFECGTQDKCAHILCTVLMRRTDRNLTKIICSNKILIVIREFCE